MMFTRKFLALFLALALFLSAAVAGCASNSNSPAVNPTPTATVKALSAQEVLNNSLEAAKKITTVTMNSNLNLDLEVTGGTQPGKVSIALTGNGAIDTTAKNLHMTANIKATLPGQGEQNIVIEVFVVNGYVYAKYNLPVLGEQWSKTKLTEADWNKMSQGQFPQMLSAMLTPNLGPSENVNGVDCYVLTVAPDLKALTAWLQSQIGQSQMGQGPQALNQFDLGQILQNTAFKQWTDKRTFLPVKDTLSLSASLDSKVLANIPNIPSVPGVPGVNQDSGKINLNFNAQINFADYGKLVVINLPQAALDAPEATPSK
jgi:hypothetical protein